VLRRAAETGLAPVSYIADDSSVRLHAADEVLMRARRVHTGLAEAGVRPGDPVVVVSASNPAFLSAFWGCVSLGALPAPLAPAGGWHAGRVEDKIARVWMRRERPFVGADDASSVRGSVPSARVLLVGELEAHAPAGGDSNPDPDSPAFIQFSSGSTGEPKGVVLTHANLLANMESIGRAAAFTADDSTLNWMPLYHDMGLIGFHLTPLYALIPQFQLEPRHMIRRPLLWLDALEGCRATITGGPNFAYELVLRALERQPERRRDLSSVRLVVNGAEPISVATMERFLERTACFGLRREAMCPVYGLAEASLAVAFSAPGSPPLIESLDRRMLQENRRAVASDGPDAVRFAVEGPPAPSVEIRIVDDEDRVLDEGAAGHIQVRGPNVMQGYWRDPEATRQAFCGDWLRTGDLGFLRTGRLIVTGRAKDLIFVNGQNLYAHDLEAAAAAAPGVQAGKVAVSAWTPEGDGRERLALFIGCVSEKAAAPVFADAVRRIRRTFGIAPGTLVPLRPNGFPKTTSGKLQRYVLRQRLERGEFRDQADRMGALVAAEEARRAAKTPPSTEMEKILHRMWCEQMRMTPESVGTRDTFEELAVESIDAAALIAAIEKRFQVRLHSEVLAVNPTIESLARYLEKRAAAMHGRGRYFRGGAACRDSG